MDFNLSEDDLGIDCMSFVDNPPNASIMREVCGEKTAYQDAPPPPPVMSNPRTISNMLNDEAPDNFLSSAAIEKNIFSDDDEYGLQRLKKSERNFEKPAWDSDFNTDDVIKKESDLGLDLDNLAPSAPVPPPEVDEPSKSASSKEVQKSNLEDKNSASKENVVENGFSDGSEEEDSDCEILYEVETDSNPEKYDFNVIEEVDDRMDFGNNNQLDKEQDNDRDEKYLLALNDHNYISFTSFGSVLQYVRYNMTPAERIRLLDLLTVKKCDNAAIIAKIEAKDATAEDMDDNASLATTKSFYRSDGEDVEENSNEGSDQEDINNENRMEVPEDSRSNLTSQLKICKEELMLDEDHEPRLKREYRSQSMDSLAESDDTYEYRDEENESENEDNPAPEMTALEKGIIYVKREKEAPSENEESQHSATEEHPKSPKATDNSANSIDKEIQCELDPDEDSLEKNNDENESNIGLTENHKDDTCESKNIPANALVEANSRQEDSEARKPSSEGASTMSAFFSENRSEPNEFLDTEETSSTLSEDTLKSCHLPTPEKVLVKNEPVTNEVNSEIEEKDSNENVSDQGVEDKENEESVELPRSVKQENSYNAIPSATEESKKDEDAAVNPPSPEPEHPKLIELKTFANRLLKFCKSPCDDDDNNLNVALKELLNDFRDIVGQRPCIDKSMQTEKMYSKEKRTKMNEKAKKKLLNTVSSSSDSDSSSSDDELEAEPVSCVNEMEVDDEEVNEEIEETNGDEDKLEKSPSYSDLSGRASSEEFLNTEADDQEVLSNDLDLSKYVVPSEKPSTQESDDLDLSKYEVRSEAESLKQESKSAVDSDSVTGSHVTTKSESNFEKDDVTNHIDSDEDIVMNYENDDNELIFNKQDENEVVDKENEAVEITSDVDLGYDDIADLEDDESVSSEGEKKLKNIIENDEKLKSEPLVVVNKLSEEDLEEYYDELREKEIRRLLSYSGVIKKRPNDIVQSSSDKILPPQKSKKTKKLLEILKETDNDICSDESASDVEEEKLTERDFLKLCNEKAKDDFLKSASSDSELENKVSDVEDLEAINLSGYSSSEDEEGPSIIDKFLEKFSTKVEEPEEPIENEIAEEIAEEKDAEPELAKEPEVTPEIEKKTDDDIEKDPGSVPSDDFNLNDLSDDSSADESSDDVVEVNEGASDANKEKLKTDKSPSVSESDKNSISAPKASTSSGISRTIRNLLLGEKEIDIDALEKEPVSTSKDDEEEDIEKSLSRKPTSTKSLETLIEESRRRQNAKSADSTAVVTLDSDSDLEEVSSEAEVPKRSIKPMLRKDQLAGETRVAQRRENERLRRLDKKIEMLNRTIEEHKSELQVSGEENRTDELILDFHNETQKFIKVHPDLVKQLKPHQIDGIKFMYDNTYGSVDHLKKHPGSGCILAHCMGLGKTLQIVALLHTVINYKELDTSKILVLCPKSTVMNWADEIRRWLGPMKCTNLKIFSFSDVTTSIEDKIKILREWASSGKPGYRKAGVLLLGYEAFRMLVLNPLHKKRIVSQAQTEKLKKVIRENLLEPGADLVICDEGHIIKNRKSATSTAVSEINTPRRIILTGTPIQNNLKEYYAMVNFIKPKFLGTEKEFANLYENPIRNGQHKDSNKHDIKIMKQRSFVLHKKLSKFVQRREAALLKTFLPMKFEYVLFIPMTDVQTKLYEHFLEVSSKREGSKGKTLIPDYTCLRKVWTHPRVLENAWKNAMLKKRDTKKSPIREPNSDDEVPDDVYDQQTGALSVTDDWWRQLLTPDNLASILTSGKLQAMFEILRMCEDNGEKCLIFSAFVAVLDCVEYFMHEITKQSENAREYGLTKYRGPWISGKDYYRLDGKTPKSIRHEMVKRFNDPNMLHARVFLISAKAGGQGINLTGANRVIILDTSWNPSNDQQNIFRVFRLGQKRQCYVYRLLAMGTMEEKVYSRSVTKQAMSFRVVDEQQIDRHYSMAELTELYTLTKPDYQNRPVPLLPQDSILASLLRNSPHLVYKYHEHDSLLENKLEQELSEQEKADAWDAYERDLKSSQNPDFLTGLNSMPALFPNPAYLPPGMGYGFPDRNYPIGFGPGLPQGYLSSLGYSSNSSLLDMLKMYPTPPALPGSLNPGANGNNPGNMMHPYGSGVLPPNVPTSSSHPANLPPFSSFQSMVASTGINSMPSFTSPYSTMANTYGLSADPALLRLSQMYASSLGGPISSSGLTGLDNRPPSGHGLGPSSSTNNSSDKRHSPFPTGLMPPTTMAESIPTSVIKPPQAHSSSNARHALQTPSLSQQLSSQMMPMQLPKPSSSGNSEVPSLQQQLLAQSRLPPPGLPSLLSNHLTTPRLPDVPFSKPDSVSSTKAHSTTTSSANSVASIMASLSTTASNRNSPITVSKSKSPHTKGPSLSNAQRATNMGIVYPTDSSAATITPILSPASSTGPSSSGISVRSVSSINSGPGSKNTIPANIISKPGANLPPNISSILKQNSNTVIPNSAISTNTSVTVSSAGKQQMHLGKSMTHPSDKQPSPNSLASSLLAQLRQHSPLSPKDRNASNASPGTNADKSATQILGSNNVQLTKVPNKRSVLSKSQKNLVGGHPPLQTTQLTTPRNKTPQGHMPPGAPNSVITKSRSNAGMTMVPVHSSSGVNSAHNSNSGKMLHGSNAVPTLAPLSSKTNSPSSTRPTVMTSIKGPGASPANLSTSGLGAHHLKLPPARAVNSPVGILKKSAHNMTRVVSPMAKPNQPHSTVSSTAPGNVSVKRSISLTNLPAAKQTRPTVSNPQMSRQQSQILSNPSHQRIANTGGGKLQNPLTGGPLSASSSSLNSVNTTKGSLSIRSIDAINKFANAGITISPGKSKTNSNQQNVLGNVMNQGNNNVKLGNLSNSITLSKVVGPGANRKRPAVNPIPSNSTTNLPKKPRTTQPEADRYVQNVAESLLRARSNQGLTILLKNPQGTSQKTNKDGKSQDVVEID